MEKISGIIPASPRVTSVDHSGSNSTRPGAPTFGAPKGISSLERNDRFSKSSVANNITDTFMNSSWKKRDLAKAGIVEKMSDVFFQSRVAGEKSPEVYIVALPVVEGGSDDSRSQAQSLSFQSERGQELSPVSTYSADAEPEPVTPQTAGYLNVKG